MAIKGRPKEFEDKPIKKNFDLPKELVGELQLAAKKRKQPVVGVVRIALEKELGLTGDAKPTTKNVSLINESTIEAAVLSALEKHDSQKPEGHIVSLSSDLEEKLEKVSRSIGFSEPSQLIEELLRTVLREPVKLREMVVGKALLDLEAALGVPTGLEVEQPKKARKAA